MLLREKFHANNDACRRIVKHLKLPRSRAGAALSSSRRATSPPPERLTSSPPHHLVISPRPTRPPFYNPPFDKTTASRSGGALPGPPSPPSPSTPARAGRRTKLRPQSAHACSISREWRQAAQCKLPMPNPSLDRVHTPWHGGEASKWSLRTDAPWTTAVPQPTLFTPIPLRRSLMSRPASPCNSYAPRQPFALASMPAGVSTRATLPPPRDRQLGWVR